MNNRQADESLFAELSDALASAAVAAIGPWVEAAVAARSDDDGSLHPVARQAGEQATDELGEELRVLLATDIDEQRTNPLAVLRGAVPYVTAVLRSAGVPPVARDRDAVALHPDDQYDVTPGAFIDFGEDVHEAGIRWGAGKAHLHLSRRRETSA